MLATDPRAFEHNPPAPTSSRRYHLSMQVKRLPMVSVPWPCPISWDVMRGTDKARLCAECSRQVYDLSAMSSDEAERLLDCGDERRCIRLTRGPDGQVVTKDR